MVKISNVIAIRDYLEVSMASALCAPCAPWLQNMGEKNQQSRSQPVSCLLFSVKCGFGGYETPRCEQMQGTAILEGDRDFEERKGEECGGGREKGREQRWVDHAAVELRPISTTTFLDDRWNDPSNVRRYSVSSDHSQSPSWRPFVVVAAPSGCVLALRWPWCSSNSDIGGFLE